MAIGNDKSHKLTGEAAPTPAPAVMHGEAEQLKMRMIRDVVRLLGPDAGPVVHKIRECATAHDLAVRMAGVTKIIALYAGDSAADRFFVRYGHLASV